MLKNKMFKDVLLDKIKSFLYNYTNQDNYEKV